MYFMTTYADARAVDFIILKLLELVHGVLALALSGIYQTVVDGYSTCSVRSLFVDSNGTRHVCRALHHDYCFPY